MLVGIVKIDRIKRKQKIVIINPLQLDVLKYIVSPVLFCPTHRGKCYIQVMAEVLGTHQWALLSGNPHELSGTIEGTWLQLNGVIVARLIWVRDLAFAVEKIAITRILERRCANILQIIRTQRHLCYFSMRQDMEMGKMASLLPTKEFMPAEIKKQVNKMGTYFVL